MNLKEYIENADIVKLMAGGVMTKMLELEAIERYLNVMLGIEIDILVRPAKPIEGRFYGKNLIEKLK